MVFLGSLNIQDIKIEDKIAEIQLAIQNDNNITPKMILNRCNAIYDTLGVSETQRQRIKDLSKLQGFAINANVELQFFGIVAQENSSKIRRCLMHQDLLLPKPPSFDKDYFGVIEDSPYCKAIRGKIKKNGQTYYTIDYWITWIGFHKVMTRCYRNDKYSTYFAIQNQVSSMILDMYD